jgi:hypothetical protein
MSVGVSLQDPGDVELSSGEARFERGGNRGSFEAGAQDSSPDVTFAGE